MDYRWWTLVAVVTALALDLLDITILNVAIPHLMAEFGVGIGDTQWVVPRRHGGGDTGHRLSRRQFRDEEGFPGRRYPVHPTAAAFGLLSVAGALVLLTTYAVKRSDIRRTAGDQFHVYG